MLPLHPRQTDILDIARIWGRVDVESLAEKFNVTPQTIRKDLNELCERDILHRVHGGAVYPSSTSNFAYLSRRSIASDAKSSIANKAASFDTQRFFPDHEYRHNRRIGSRGTKGSRGPDGGDQQFERCSHIVWGARH